MSSDTRAPSRSRRGAASISTRLATRRQHARQADGEIAPDLPPIEDLSNDPAILIGLALGYSRQSRTLGSPIPDVILSRLYAHADRGDPACRLLIDWFDLWSGKPVCGPKTAIIAAEAEGRTDG
jgi:hypothetical protein